MREDWIHIGDMPTSARILAEDGTESVEPLREPVEGEVVVRVLESWPEAGESTPGAVVEVVVVHEKDELVLGDRLLVFDRAPCGHCETCRRGHGTLCPDFARSRVGSFRSDLLVLPAWIARRARVRLTRNVSDAAAVALGRHSWILRGLRRIDAVNPLRMLVVGDDLPAAFLGAFLEVRWPDARRILWGRGGTAGFHAVVPMIDDAQATAFAEQPFDLVIALRSFDGRRIASMMAPGCRIVLASQAVVVETDALWPLEAQIQSVHGSVPSDVDSWKKVLEAFSARWETLSA